MHDLNLAMKTTQMESVLLSSPMCWTKVRTGAILSVSTHFQIWTILTILIT